MPRQPTKQDLESAQAYGAAVKALYLELKPIVDGHPWNVVMGAAANIITGIILTRATTQEAAYAQAGRVHEGLRINLEEAFANKATLDALDEDGTPKH
jgi:hypothetical protein